MRLYDIVAHRSKEIKKSDIVGFVHTEWKKDRVRLWRKDPSKKSKKSLCGNPPYEPHLDDVVMSWRSFQKLKLDRSKLIWHVDEL